MAASRRLIAIALTLAFLCLAPPLAVAKDLRGVALVIGEANYDHLPKLDNPKSDARAMDGLLGDLGFEVDRVLDGDHAEADGARSRISSTRPRMPTWRWSIIRATASRRTARTIWCRPTPTSRRRKAPAQTLVPCRRPARRTGEDRAGDHRAARCLPHQCVSRRATMIQLPGDSAAPCRSQRRGSARCAGRRRSPSPACRPTISAWSSALPPRRASRRSTALRAARTRPMPRRC